MSVKLLFSIISLLMVIASPICFVVYLKKVKKLTFNFWNILAGIVTEFLSKEALLRLAIYGIAASKSINRILTSQMSYGFVVIILTTIILVAMISIVVKIYFKGKIDIETASSLAIGFIIADTMMNYLMQSISNIIYTYQMNNGTLYNNLLEMVSAEQAKQVIDLYNSYSNGYFLYFGIIAFASVCSNYLIVMLIADNNSDHSLKTRILFATILMVTAVFYYTNPLTFKFANIILLAFGMCLFGFAHFNSKED